MVKVICACFTTEQILGCFRDDIEFSPVKLLLVGQEGDLPFEPETRGKELLSNNGDLVDLRLSDGGQRHQANGRDGFQEAFNDLGVGIRRRQRVIEQVILFQVGLDILINHNHLFLCERSRISDELVKELPGAKCFDNDLADRIEVLSCLEEVTTTAKISFWFEFREQYLSLCEINDVLCVGLNPVDELGVF